MKQNWLEIILIWLMVAVMTVALVINLPRSVILGPFAAVLAGSLALVSMVQLFRAEPKGFVRRLVYVGGGSYLILTIATAYVWFRL
ncbi:MAG: hypothetical protein KA500_01470 [Rhodoluna sp.]|nr:hypothetical protein [Rhodoluna sp.]MBP6186368.1 hypothetical protein [Rhodoluna sp.]